MTAQSNAAPEWLVQRFEAERGHLRAVAYRMLGSLSEADDVVQDAWLRASRAETADVANVRAWLTTVVARLCLDALRARKSRREELVGLELPDPIVMPPDGPLPLAGDPEHQALTADSVGLAMMVVLDTLAPSERLAFVLHDVFGVPFDEIGRMVDRSPTAARQLASRARRRVRGAGQEQRSDRARHKRVVAAFLAAARDGDFAALIELLDPDVVVHADLGRSRGGVVEVRGAEVVARQALSFRRMAPGARPAMVNGVPGFAVFARDRPFAVIGFTIARDRIAELYVWADRERLARVIGGSAGRRA